MNTFTTLLHRTLLGYKRQGNRSKALLWTILGVLILLALPVAIRKQQIDTLKQSRMYFLPPTTDIIPGEVFPVEVRIQTNGTPVNAVSAHVQFKSQFLEVVNMTTEKSFCTFYLDNSFDNIKGEVNVSCGIPNPGFLGDTVVVRMNMRAKAVGSTTVTLDPERSQVLANDGKGTNIAQELPDLPLTVKPIL
ncbi:MAG TPA: cohesin domain-containing protein [Verrucomicrobiae bacterium]|nr:cohesin domain-containing protein [Verrucomicrobiae bacterium]